MRVSGTANLKGRQRGHFKERSSSHAGGCHRCGHVRRSRRPLAPAIAAPRRSAAGRAAPGGQAGSIRAKRGPEPTDQPAPRTAAQGRTAESENVNYSRYGQLRKWILVRPPQRAGPPQARSRQDGGAGGRLPRMRGWGSAGVAAA